MIVDDEEYNRILDRMNFKVIDGRLYADVLAMMMVNESLANYIVDNAQNFTQDQFWALASTIEMYRALWDTASNKFAQEMVPDDLSDLDG